MSAPVHPYSDYGVALRQLRGARTLLSWLLAIAVFWQLAGFSLMYFTQQPYRGMHPKMEAGYTVFDALRDTLKKAADGSATQPAMPLTGHLDGSVDSPSDFFPPAHLNIRPQWNTTYSLAVPLTQIVGLVSAASQVILVFLTLLVILVAQAPGVTQVTRSLIWTVVLFFLAFPWQTLARDFPISGFLYSYPEMLRLLAPQVTGQHVYGLERLLIWARFIVFPLFGLLLVLIASERFRAGLMLAVGHPLQSMMQPRQGMPVPTERKTG
jgi:hypothetical protein